MHVNSDFRQTVCAAKEGDASAFNTLFARNLPPLVAFIRMKAGGGILDRESVHDLAQSVCREVLLDFDQFEYRGEKEFRSWLFLQATRKILDRSRYHGAKMRDAAQAVEGGDAEELLECYATFCTPSQSVNSREEIERIDAALQTLPENQREAIALSRVLELSYAATAERMGCSESAVRGLVARGLATLSMQLAKDEPHGSTP